MAVLLEMPRFWSERDKYLYGKKKSEEYDMCQAMRELIEDGRAEGKAEGVQLAARIFHLLNDKKEIENAALAKECRCSMEEVQTIRSAFGI